MKGRKSDPTYKKIDRQLESELVLEYQKTGDEATLMRVFEPRMETLRFLACKYHYLCEDMESELLTVFMRAVRKYGRAKRAKSFNTYFYTSCLNHVRNMAKAKARGKRTNVNGVNPEPSFVRLDDTISAYHEEGAETYHDIVEGREDCFNMPELREFMRIVESRSWVLLDIMLDIAASGIRCTNRVRYRRSLCGVADDDVKKAIAEDVGLPRQFYRIESHEFRGDVFEYEITVSGRKASDLLKEMLENFREG